MIQDIDKFIKQFLRLFNPGFAVIHRLHTVGSIKNKKHPGRLCLHRKHNKETHQAEKSLNDLYVYIFSHRYRKGTGLMHAHFFIKINTLFD